MLITNKVVLNKQIIEQLPKLKYIDALATGYNVVDTVTAKNAGIAVTKTPGIIGVGQIEQAVVKILLAIGMKVTFLQSQ